jgi:hypothetical protein
MKLRWLVVLGFMFGQMIVHHAKASVDIEIDPATFAFKGDSLHIRLNNSSQWRWGLGTYSLELPDALVDLNKHNKKQEWSVEIDRAFGLFTEYYLHNSKQGWFVGAQVSQQEFSIANADNTDVEFTNALLMLNMGYKWQFENSGFYLLPWAGLGYTRTINNKSERDSVGFDQDPISAFVTVHLGYSF